LFRYDNQPQCTITQALPNLCYCVKHTPTNTLLQIWGRIALARDLYCCWENCKQTYED